MITKITVLFLFILTLVSCTSATGVRLKIPLSSENLHKTVYIDNTFSKSEVDIITGALLEWECATNHLIIFNIKPYFVYDSHIIISDKIHTLFILKTNGHDPNIVSADARIKEIMKRDDPGLNPQTRVHTIGLYIERTNQIPIILIVMDRIAPDMMKSVVLHELGHSLEITQHVRTKDSVMFVNNSEAAKHLTKNDLEAFCKLYGCDENKLHTCH